MIWLSWILRIGLAAVFIVAGALKLKNPTEFAVEISNYRFMAEMAPLLAATLPVTEILLGVGLVILPSAWRRPAALALGCLLAMFTVAVVQAVSRGINIECGCFGAGSSQVSWWTIARNGGLIGAVGAVFWVENSRTV